MVIKGKKYFYYSAILLGMGAFTQNLSATETLQYDPTPYSSAKKLHQEYSSERREQTWGEWFNDLLEPFAKSAQAKTLQEALDDPEFIKLTVYTDLSKAVRHFNKQKITKEELQEALQDARYHVIRGLIEPSDYFKEIKGLKGISEKKQYALLNREAFEHMREQVEEGTMTDDQFRQLFETGLVFKGISKEKELQKLDKIIERKAQQALSKEKSSKAPATFSGLMYEGGKLVYKGLEYAVNNPGKTLTTLLAAQVAGAAALSTFSFGPGTATYPSVSSYANDYQNRFLVTYFESGVGVIGQSYFSNGTMSGSNFTIIGNSPVSGPSLSNGSIPLGYSNGVQYFMNYVSPGNIVGQPVQVSQTAGSLSSLNFVPLQGSNATIPSGTLFASWVRASNGYTTLVFPNGTTSGEQLFGLVDAGVSPGSNANLVVFLGGGSPSAIYGYQIGYSGGSFSHWNGYPNLCGGSYANSGLTSITPNGNILLLCNNEASMPSGTLVQELSSTGVPLDSITNVTALSGMLPKANLNVPNGNVFIYQGSNGAYSRFTSNAGISFQPEVKINTNGGLTSATALPNGDIVTVAVSTGIGYIITPNDYNPSSPTSSPTSNPTSSPTTSGQTTGTPTSSPISTSGGTPTVNPTSGNPTTSSGSGTPTVNPTSGNPTTSSGSGTPTVNPTSGNPTTSSGSGTPTVNPTSGNPTTSSGSGTPTVNPTSGNPTTSSGSGTPTVNPTSGNPTTSSGSPTTTTQPAFTSSSSHNSPSWISLGIAAGVGIINNWWNHRYN